MKIRTQHRQEAAYSLIELTVAAGVLLGGVAAAAALAMNSAQIEDINYRKGRALAISEAACRLWQLGLSPDQTRSLLLGDPALVSLTVNGEAGDSTSAVPTDQGTAIADPTTDLGTFERATVRAVVRTRAAGPNSETVPEITQSLGPFVIVR